MARKIDFNVSHAQGVSEEQFVKGHAHYADEVDLSAVYKSLQKPNAETIEPSKKASRTKKK